MAAGEILGLLARTNLAAGAAILLIILVRKSARALFGARLAYILWALPVAAGLTVLAPFRRVVVIESAPQFHAPIAPRLDVSLAGHETFINVHGLALAAWLAGVMVAAAIMIHLQRRFMQQVRKGSIGPAVVGVILPRIITPDDFEKRFDPAEQTLVLAHERAHIARQDSRLNGVSAVIQCLFWFNPLIHIAAHLMRIDQELACDEAVVTRFPDARRTYAQALVKAQLAIRPLPLGCYWPSGTEHPLLERIEMLRLEAFSPSRRLIGASAVVLMGMATAAATWAAQPPKVWVQTPAPALAAKPAPAPVPSAVTRADRAAPVPTPGSRPTAAQTADPSAIDLSRPRAVDGALVRVKWVSPTSELTIRDSLTGQEVVINTEDASSLIRAGGSRFTLRPGMPISVRGYSSVDGSRLYADPAEITSAGAPAFPQATVRADVARTVSRRRAACGELPNAIFESGKSNTEIEAAVNAWQADCEAKAGG